MVRCHVPPGTDSGEAAMLHGADRGNDAAAKPAERLRTHVTFGESVMIRIDAGDCTTAALRQMTAEQLLDFGTRHVVYLKSGMRDGEQTFMLHGADGAALVMFDTIEEAVQTAAENGLSFAAIH
jgi:hypothetical protein